MRKIIYTRPDGGLSVVHPVINTHTVSISTGEVVPVPETLTEAEAEQRAWDRLPKDAINPRWADASELPTDRTFRNAWKDTGKIEHDLGKCREITKARLRAERAPKLAALDVAFMRSVETGDAKAQADIAAQKQVLRDVTAQVDSVDDLETLKAIKV